MLPVSTPVAAGLNATVNAQLVAAASVLPQLFDGTVNEDAPNPWGGRASGPRRQLAAAAGLIANAKTAAPINNKNAMM